ncbi:MAG: pyridoxal phosphate-dependent aminotransferase [Candidatus Sericytochromatia bacterium]|nr:pyridoxal phosphate-dependent aminotransferase [Candidatus Sericytochromatia bacterium]
MRNNIVHAGSSELTYEIRGIVALARQVEAHGVPIVWENIGDPVAKGEPIPAWMKEIVRDLALQDAAYGYCPTEGVLTTRQFLAELRNGRGGAQITPNDILFFNGLGDAISRVYTLLRRETRVIGPSPAYPTHSSAEGAHAGTRPITYHCDPARNWEPDLADLENHVKFNSAISGILLINPGNPTGAVYSREILEGIVDIARRYDLFIISDEIYINLSFAGDAVPLADVIGDVPALCMAGISKELPWPGARCGWIEVYNRHVDPNFEVFVKSLFQAKMLEVCATTMPQMSIPTIMTHPEYLKHVEDRRRRYERAAEIAYDRFSQLEAVTLGKPQGAFYLSIVFRDGYLPHDGVMPIANTALREFIESKVIGATPESRFVYYLLAATGICVVPLSSFETPYQGFRMTLLERDLDRYTLTVDTIAAAIEQYCGAQAAAKTLATVTP